VRTLSWLADPGTISVLSLSTVRLVHVVLEYRLGCKEIELRRQQLDLKPGGRPAKAASARHAVRRCRRR
jgi:hypothetical protein